MKAVLHVEQGAYGKYMQHEAASYMLLHEDQLWQQYRVNGGEVLGAEGWHAEGLEGGIAAIDEEGLLV